VNKLENLFAEFILSKIDEKYNSKIEVCSCVNFTIVKGETESEEILSIQKISEEFSEKYKDHKIKNTIDLLEYKSKLDSTFEYKFIFYKESFPEKNNINYFKLSSAPFGYSWNEGKSLYFYFKHITNLIPTSYPYTWINYNVLISETGKVDFTIQDDYINNQDDVLKSAILDAFEFNISEFLVDAKKMDLEQIILNPNYDEPILKKSVGDFIII
jgi:hypothetical protein